MFFGKKKKEAVPLTEKNNVVLVQENPNLLSMDYEDRCGNCHEPLRQNDKFCRYCGTRRGDGAFAPYKNVMECIYGPPPVERRHVCGNCGYSWTTMLMIDDQKYCPRCGGNADCREQDREEPVKEEQKQNRDSQVWIPGYSEQKILFLSVVSQGKEYAFTEKPFIIGRDTRSDLYLANPRVSRQHVRMYRRDHQWYLEECNAVNGTFVNGRKLEKREICRVYEGDEIQLADERLIITDIKGNTIVR